MNSFCSEADSDFNSSVLDIICTRNLSLKGTRAKGNLIINGFTSKLSKDNNLLIQEELKYPYNVLPNLTLTTWIKDIIHVANVK